ncbi:Phototropin-1A [Cercospora beticola]|uniref:Phototropin-1A n=1 Tax=Cercospora beticola TaxID=122368 RepID=A0A2G5IBI0_CERBT|nr:Phototropin-1A [Cercospora beticola]PIB02207.1 Phototropin-1A [Cercospora beticola]WPA95955.1 hypothetical protein RHO25_000559 [Cercospora beticola]CAK1355776.1 unnamed protein product [Cercospora beticola]
MHSSRASVTQQVLPLPLILGRNESSASKASSTKRDSAIGLGGFVRKISLKRPTSQSPSHETMAPVYRLYPQQSSSGRRELRAMEKENQKDRPQAGTSLSRDRSKMNSVDTVDTAIYSPAVLNDLANGTTSQDAGHARRSLARSSTQSDGTAAQSKSIHSVDTDLPQSPNFDMDDAPGMAAAPAELSKRGIHIPTRTSSSNDKSTIVQPFQPTPAKPATWQDANHEVVPPSPDTPDEPVYDAGARSSAGSMFSQETAATSVHTLPPLQTKGPDNADPTYLEPVMEDDPRSWDLVAPIEEGQEEEQYGLEKRADQLFSAEHLRIIFEDPRLLLRFTGYLNSHRPQSIPVLIYYLDALKALRAINYANAISEALEPIKGQSFTDEPSKPTLNATLEEKANRAFESLVQEDLPAYIAHIWTQVVSVSIQRRITGTLAPHLREASEGLAEVFCLTDPSRADNPIVFASEEFTRTTQYGMNYVIGRNCRFLQGPRSSPHAVRRLAIASANGKEHVEVFVNYRRDGSPFMNLLMTAPLMDSRGKIRYYIGAQVDVSGLIKDCSEMEGLVHLLEKEQAEREGQEVEEEHKDEFQELSEMFNGAELDTVRKFGGRMHKEYVDDSDRESIHRPRLLLKDPSQEEVEKKRSMSSDASSALKERLNGKLEGVYQNYLLIRPAPSLRILFTSPSLRVPGILQSPFLNRIGGSSRVRSDLAAALGEGRGVTAKIRWLTRPDEAGEGEGRPRWIHCTPLLGHSGAVGVWMVVLVDEEGSLPGGSSGRRFRQAPPVSSNIGGKEWDSTSARERRQQIAYDKSDVRRGAAGKADYHRPASRSGIHSSAASVNHLASPTRARERGGPEPHHLTSASASEFSFNLRG